MRKREGKRNTCPQIKEELEKEEALSD